MRQTFKTPSCRLFTENVRSYAYFRTLSFTLFHNINIIQTRSYTAPERISLVISLQDRTLKAISFKYVCTLDGGLVGGGGGGGFGKYCHVFPEAAT